MASLIETKLMKQVNRLGYWVLLVVAIFGNLVMSVILLPAFVAFEGMTLYLIITLLVLVFGLLFDLLIRDMHLIGRRHVIFAGTIVPVIAIFTLYLIVRFANYLIIVLEIGIKTHNPLVVGIVYGATFILPYLLHEIIIGIKKCF